MVTIALLLTELDLSQSLADSWHESANSKQSTIAVVPTEVLT